MLYGPRALRGLKCVAIRRIFSAQKLTRDFVPPCLQNTRGLMYRPDSYIDVQQTICQMLFSHNPANNFVHGDELKTVQTVAYSSARRKWFWSARKQATFGWTKTSDPRFYFTILLCHADNRSTRRKRILIDGFDILPRSKVTRMKAIERSRCTFNIRCSNSELCDCETGGLPKYLSQWPRFGRQQLIWILQFLINRSHMTTV